MLRHHRYALLSLCLVAIGISYATAAERQSSPKKIVLIAGPITGHPKQSHEYEKNVILLKHLLDISPNVRGIHCETHFRGWPQDPKTLDDADTIVIISDGGDRNATDHPLYVGDRLEQLERQMKRGCGLVMFHWSTFNPSRHHDKVTEWVGGYFDYETGSGPNKWFSAIKTWEGPTQLDSGHPITRGVKPFRVKEEFYYNVRFRDGDTRVKPIVTTRPPGEDRDFPVGWAVERADGGRGFGYTGGHFYENWWLPDYRRLILNAILWTAQVEVPESGVESNLGDPIRALIVTGHNHPAHDWRKVTAALIPVLEQDPRVFVDVTEQPEDLATARIVEYDVLVMNYSNWDRPGLSDAAKSNFANYLDRGGGLAVVHFANGAFTDTLPNKESDWPEYRTRIVRRIWVHGPDESGHDAFGPFSVEPTVEGKLHPITKGLERFDTVDELYFRQRGELPIVPLATAKSKVTNADEPMAWAYEYGKGRVFQTVLGHADVSIRAAGALVRRGTVWAARQEPLSFDPPVAITENYLFRDGSQWTPAKSAGTSERSSSAAAADGPPLVQGKFARALDARVARAAAAPSADYRKPPITVECWARIASKEGFQILVANEEKRSASHWEMYAFSGTGNFTVYMPGMSPDHVHSSAQITDNQWHYLAMVFEPQKVSLFVDGSMVASQSVSVKGRETLDGELAFGSLVERTLGCDGQIDEVRISRGVRDVSRVPAQPLAVDEQTIGLWRFDKLADEKVVTDESSQHTNAMVERVKKK